MSAGNPQESLASKLLLPFGIASVSSCTATGIVQPFDTIKSRMQLQSEVSGGSRLSTSGMIKKMAAEGVGAFYAGAGAALLRQLFYGTTRVGMYRYLYDKEKKKNGHVPFYKKMLSSMLSGATGCFFGSPFDISLVRMQIDQGLPADQRRNYKGVSDAISRIIREEGFTKLWKSYSINSVRSATLSSVMLSTNDEIKEWILKKRNLKKSDTPTNLISSAIAGVFCSLASLPLDNVKMKHQKMRPLADGSLPYKSIPDIFLKTFQREGIRGFWTGYPAFYVRVGPHAMIMLMLTDLLHKQFDPKYQL